jgi:hypothetical protein
MMFDILAKLDALVAGVAPGAGEAHIGQVGGTTTVLAPAIAVEATPDYSDGDAVGGKVALSNVARVAAGSGYLTRFQLRSLISITVQTFVHIFSANPAASTFTENGALSIHADDRAKVLKTIAIAAGDWVAPKGGSPWYTVEMIGPKGGLIDFLPYQLASGRDLYFAIEADGTINFASTADLACLVAAENN